MNTIDDCRIINLGKHPAGRRGNLTVGTGMENVPFEIKRVYCIYDVPGGADRGSHAHYELDQLIVALAGSFEIAFDDGTRTKRVRLSRPDEGVMVPAGIWHQLENFSSGAVALSLTSDVYKESDYMREYADFKKYRAEND